MRVLGQKKLQGQPACLGLFMHFEEFSFDLTEDFITLIREKKKHIGMEPPLPPYRDLSLIHI